MLILRGFRSVACVLVCAAGLATTGCGKKDEIRTFEVAHEPVRKRDLEPARLLALVVPTHEHAHMVFKISGPETAMKLVRDDVIHLFKKGITVEKTDDKTLRQRDFVPQIDWKLRDTWFASKPNAEFVDQEVSVPAGDKNLRLTASFFRNKFRPLPNVNRWRDQLDRNAITENELKFLSESVTLANGLTATLFEIRGHVAKEEPVRDKYLYELPKGWVKAPPVAFSELSVFVPGDPRPARVTLSAVGGGMGANLNRWRTQLQLDEQPEDQLRKEAKACKLLGMDGLLVDYEAKVAKLGVADRIVGIAAPAEAPRYYLKFSGPKEIVAAHREAFEKFAASIKPAPNPEE